MMDRQQLIDLQNSIVLCLAKAVNEPWEFLLVSFEQEEIDGERTQEGEEIGHAPWLGELPN